MKTPTPNPVPRVLALVLATALLPRVAIADEDPTPSDVAVEPAAEDAEAAAPAKAPCRHYTWREFERSPTAEMRGIDNSIPAWARDDVRALCLVLDPVREFFDHTIRITSGFRSDALNEAIGGRDDAPHLTGKGVDVTTDDVSAGRRTAEWLANRFVESGVPFDTATWHQPASGGYVEITYDREREQQRRLVLAGAEAAPPVRRPQKTPADRAADAVRRGPPPTITPSTR